MNYRHILKSKGAVVLFASQPFTSALVMSNPDWFKYEWIWKKSRPTGHVHAKNKPMKAHENVLVFSPGVTNHAHLTSKRMEYNPQGLVRKSVPTIRKQGGEADTVMGWRPSNKDVLQEYEGYPNSVLDYSGDHGLHPTQKPVALCEYLIRTYTNEGDTVLDNCFGSGTTGVACINTNRNFIGIEKDDHYFKVGSERIEEAMGRHTSK